MTACNKTPSRLHSAMNGVLAALSKLPKVRYPISIAALALGLAMLDVRPVRAQTDLQLPPSWIDQQHAEPLSSLADLRQGLQADNNSRLDLVQAYERMLLHDPQIHAARAARDAGRDAKNIARAALLPQASINYMRNRTRKTEDYTVPGQFPWMPDQDYTARDSYYGRRTGLTIEQSLFDYSAISTYRMGKTQSEYAEVQFRLEYQQEAVTLIDAYLNALLARDSLELARHQLSVYRDMLQGNERMVTHGEGTRIDVLETRTQMTATQAELVVYENALADRLRELSALLGGPVQAAELLAIDPNSALPPLHNGALETLVGDALRENPEVQAARLAVRYNEQTIEREKGQFMPRVSLYAAHDRIVSDTVNNQGRDYKTNTIGLQVSIPLFSGGSSFYSTRQAYNRRDQARFELNRTTDTTTTMVEQYYRVFTTSAERADTLRRNVDDSRSLVDAMHKSVAGGERTNTDALQAERQSYQARQELLRTYVEWFQAYAKLQFYAGRFSEDDVLVLNQQLVAQVQ